jgi:hypothetical protein
VGPLRQSILESPTRKTEDLYIDSVNHTLESYESLARYCRAGPVIYFRCANHMALRAM